MNSSSMLSIILVFLLGGAAILQEVSVPRDALGCFVSDLSGRTEEQRENIGLAALAIDGARIEPGAVFSFNRVVGPRTIERGYRLAPAFLDSERTDSVGGGLCQLSSTLYAAVLAAGFPIVERFPHRFRVFSVPPGRDATVWYGRADLSWRNDLPEPVRIEANAGGNQLVVRILGRSKRRVTLSTREVPSSRLNTLAYLTCRRVGGETCEILDRYWR